MSKLNDILLDIWYRTGNLDDAEQQIKGFMLELIGPNEQYTVVGHTYTDLGHATEHIGDGEAEWKDPRNDLRAELRQKVNEL